MRRFFDFDFDGLKLDGMLEIDVLPLQAVTPLSINRNSNYIISAEDNIDGDENDNVLTGTINADVINGFGGNDTINGLAGDDVINGGDGDDVLSGGPGNDTVNGGRGDDIILLDENGNDTIDGGRDYDIARQITDQSTFTGVIYSSTSLATFSIYTRTDRLNLTTLFAVERFEQYDLATNSLQILALLLTPGDDILDLSSEGVQGQAIVAGGNGDDTIIAASSNDGIATPTLFSSLGGANRFFGGNGADTLIGNIYSDFLGGGAGSDILTGGGGADVFGYASFAGEFSDQITDMDLDDIIILSTSFTPRYIGDVPFDGTFTNTMRYEASGGQTRIEIDFDADQVADETLLITNGEFGIFAFTANNGNMNLRALPSFMANGTAGDDILSGTALGDTINVLSGNDELFGLDGDDILNGGAGDDIIRSGRGLDTVNAGDGDDLVIWDEINDDYEDGEVYDGGDGVDTLRIYGYFLGVSNNIVDLEAGTFTDVFGNSVSILNFENFDGRYTHERTGFTIYGTSGDNLLYANHRASSIYGREGDDYLLGTGEQSLLEGGAGADIINGSTPFSTSVAVYDSSDAGVTINLVTGTGSGGHAEGDILININYVNGSAFNDVLIGNEGDNTLVGGRGGDNFIDGGAGDDFLAGSNTGDDHIMGGAGSDFMNGGGGIDTVDYSLSTSRVVLSTAFGGTVGDAEGDTYLELEEFILSNFNDVATGSASDEFFYGGNGNDIIYGQSGNDRLFGEAGNDRLYGEDGNDVLEGGSGNDIHSGGTGIDRFLGGAGNDIHLGGGGIDTVDYRFASSAVEVDLANGGTLGDAAGDTYFGVERVLGSTHDDIIIGASSSDNLHGREGNDYIYGGDKGNDSLFGQEGVDSFGYHTGTGGRDFINDFQAGAANNEVVYILGGDPAFDSFAEVIATAVDNADGSVTFNFGGRNTLTFVGLQAADFDMGDFSFAAPPAGNDGGAEKAETFISLIAEDIALPELADFMEMDFFL